MKTKLSPQTKFLFGAALLVTLTGCVGYVDGPRGGVYVEPPTVQVSPVYYELDDYIYYPRYQVYYGSRSHHYYYQEGRSWVGYPQPRGISVNVLVASPSVNVNFHDSPAAHHSEVIRSYPKNWKPSVENRGRKEDQRDDRKDDKRDDHKR